MYLIIHGAVCCCSALILGPTPALLLNILLYILLNIVLNLFPRAPPVSRITNVTLTAFSKPSSLSWDFVQKGEGAYTTQTILLSMHLVKESKPSSITTWSRAMLILSKPDVPSPVSFTNCNQVPNSGQASWSALFLLLLWGYQSGSVSLINAGTGFILPAQFHFLRLRDEHDPQILPSLHGPPQIRHFLAIVK